MSNKQKIGVVGLSVMGENIALNFASKGFSVSVYNRTSGVTEKFLSNRAVGHEIFGYEDIGGFVHSLESPRKILMMIRAGEPVDSFIDQLLPFLEQGDIIVDGGNSHHQDSLRRMKFLKAKEIRFVGSGISGGEIGALRGPSIMPGGDHSAWQHLEPIFTTIAAKAEDGSPCCAWMGPGGAGHFVKMVHNGIEYGDMQLICETYQVMKVMLEMSAAEIHSVFAEWNRGDLQSYLIEITADIMSFLDEDGEPLIDKILDVAQQKGTGKWTVNAALDFGVPLSLISESVFARCLSSHKKLRLVASARLNGPGEEYSGDKSAMLGDLGKALFGAKIISYAQGFGLLRAASNAFGWNLKFGEIARIWRSGCIIRSAFLDDIADAFREKPALENLLFDPYFNKIVTNSQTGLRNVISASVMTGIAMPSFTSALNYYDGLRRAESPANLLQAQRDYFGAHMYERTDRPRGEWFHTNWTGRGSDTTSAAY